MPEALCAIHILIRAPHSQACSGIQLFDSASEGELVGVEGLKRV